VGIGICTYGVYVNGMHYGVFKQTLLVFERKIFRRIYGPKYENGEWES
jgi:hypothetical protein